VQRSFHLFFETHMFYVFRCEVPLILKIRYSLKLSLISIKLVTTVFTFTGYAHYVSICQFHIALIFIQFSLLCVIYSIYMIASKNFVHLKMSDLFRFNIQKCHICYSLLCVL